MKILSGILYCSVLFGSSVFAAETEIKTITVSRMTADTALVAARAAIQACRKKGIQVAATVVDRDGNVQVTLRDTIAAPLTLEISRQKAFTAANFNAATSRLTSRANSPVGRIDGLVMSAGGVPIQVAGTLVGAIGVSGAPSGKTDEECAKAGVEPVQSELEMMMQ